MFISNVVTKILSPYSRHLIVNNQYRIDQIEIIKNPQVQGCKKPRLHFCSFASFLGPITLRLLTSFCGCLLPFNVLKDI